MRFKSLFIVAGAFATTTAVYLIWPEWFGFCAPHQTSKGLICSSPYGYPYGVTLLPLSLALLGASLLAFFTSGKTFRRWARFTLWYGIIAALITLIVPNIGINGGFVSLPLVELHILAQMLAWLYVGISVLLLGISELMSRRKG